MKLLILGGTQFVGRLLAEMALDRGDEVTLFNRGKSNPGLFPNAENIHGDRDSDLNQLEGRIWDAAVDFSGYFPRIVRKSTEQLAGSIRQYVFISSVAVYTSHGQQITKEDFPLAEMDDPDTEEMTPDTYGPLKVLCEREVIRAFPQNSLIIRPGVMVGPYDTTDRFTYWVERLSHSGVALAPGNPDSPLQFIDGRDLAEWMLRLLDRQVTGTYNAIGFNENLTMGKMLNACTTVTKSDANLLWVPDEFLLEQNVAPWKDLPLWLPENEPHGLGHIDNSSAVKMGLTFRPIESTARDTWNWILNGRDAAAPFKAGISREREAEILEAYRHTHESEHK